MNRRSNLNFFIESISLFIGLFAGVIEVFGIPPTINITSPLNTTYSSSLIDLNWTYDVIPNWTAYSINGTVNITLVKYAGYEWSFQEDGSAISCIGEWNASYPCSKTYDGNWSSYGQTLPSVAQGDVYINYSKPSNAFSSSLILVKDESGEANLSIPAGCWSQDPLQVKATSWAGVGQWRTWWYCMDSGSWTQIRDIVGTFKVYELGIWWNVSVNTSFFNTTFTAFDGFNSVTVYANDSVGAINSSTVYFTVDTTPPIITIDTPANWTYWNHDDLPFYVNGTCADALSGISMFHTNSSIWAAYGSDTFFNISNSTEVPEGLHTIGLFCNDTLNNTALSGLIVIYDNTPPELSVVFPPNNSVLSQNSINVTGTASDNNTAAIFMNDSGFGQNTGNYIDWNFTKQYLPDGTYQLMITANDSSDNNKSVHLTFTIDTTPPFIDIIFPQNSSYNSADLSVNWTRDSTLDWASYSLNGASNETGIFVKFGLIKNLTDPTDSIISIYADSHYIYSSSTDQNVYAWNRTNLSIAAKLAGWDILRDVFADSEYVYAADDFGLIDVWNRTNLSLSAMLFNPHANPVYAVHADKDHIYGGDIVGNIIIWNRTNMSVKLSINDSSSIKTIHVDSEFLYAAEESDTEYYVWNVGDFSLNTTLTDGTSNARDIFADANYIYGANADGCIYVWNRTNLSLKLTLNDSTSDKFSVYSDADYIYAGTIGGWDGQLYIWKKDGFGLFKNSSQSSGELYSVFVYDEHIYGGGEDNMTHIWQKEMNESNFTVTASEGANNITIWANDTLGNMNMTTVWFTVDMTKPTITILQPFNSTYRNNTIEFNITASEDLDQSIVQLNNINHSMVNQSGQWQYFNGTLPQGTYGPVFWFNDTVGNANWTNIVFTIDTFPIITIESPLNMTYNFKSMSFNITLDQDGSSCNYSLSGSANKTMEKHNSTAFGAYNSSMADGSHTIVYTCDDATGNKNSTSVQFMIDIVPPVVVIHAPGNNTIPNDLFNFSYFDAHSGIDCSSYSIDSGSNFTNCSIINNSWTGSFNSITDGPHILIVYANDSSGNANSTSVQWRKDTKSPRITITYPLNNSVVSRSLINITGTAYDENPFSISANGTTFGTNVGNLSSWNYTNNSVADGIYVFEISANDSIGNNNSTYISFTIDTSPPTISYISYMPYIVNVNDDDFNSLFITNVSDTLSSIEEVSIIFYNASQFNSSLPNYFNQSLNASTGYWIFNSDCLIHTTFEGVLHFNITAVDHAGNKKTAYGGYISFNYTANDNHTVVNTSFSITNTNGSQSRTATNDFMVVEIEAVKNITNASLGLVIYTINPVKDNTGYISINRFVQVEATPDIISSMTSARIRINYTEDDLANSGVDEDTVKSYYWNDTLGAWVMCENTATNTSGNYVMINLTHFSLYGLFGSLPSIPNSDPDGDSNVGSGGSGGGGLTCTEEWICTAWSECSPANRRKRTCSDKNECGTEEQKPIEIGSCIYVSQSISCVENWTCSEWSSCSAAGTQERICTDMNSCGTEFIRPEQNRMCTSVPAGQAFLDTGLDSLILLAVILAIAAAVSIKLVYKKRHSKSMPYGPLHMSLLHS